MDKKNIDWRPNVDYYYLLAWRCDQMILIRFHKRKFAYFFDTMNL